MKKILGVLFVCFALLSLGSTFLPVLKHEINYSLDKFQNPQDIQVELPLDTDFGIMIPKIHANAKVIRNVDPFDADIYQKALSQGVAHAKGTALPNEKGNVFIFSHSSADFLNASRFNSIFYLLGKLEVGDEIKLFFENKEYDYLVDTKNIVASEAIEYLSDHGGQNRLTLMTCWPPGTSYKRLVITALPKKNL